MSAHTMTDSPGAIVFRYPRRPVWSAAVIFAAPFFFAAATPFASGVVAQSPVGRQLSAPLLLPEPKDQPQAQEAADDRQAEANAVQATVVAFLGVECPLARIYARRLNALAVEYSQRGIRFALVDSNQQDSEEEIARFVDELKLDVAVTKDADHRLADLLKATHTPQVFVIDEHQTIRYVGRVDDQYAFGQGVGYQRAQVGRHDLREALEDLLAGREVAVPETKAVGCVIGRPVVPKADSDITWSGQIAEIFQRRCQACHRPGEVAPFSLLAYEDAAAWQNTIAEVIEAGRMPPWGASPQFGEFVNEARLTDEERQQVLTWIARGAPPGDLTAQPPPRSFVTGWQIGRPDEVIYMAEEPFQVPADGLVDYQYFDVDPGFTTDRWVKAVECRSGAPAVVHHINVFLLKPDMPANYEREDLTNHLLWGTAPGLQSVTFAPGMAYRIPAGTKLVFQMHYTTNGVAQADRSYMGLIYADESDVRQRVEMKLAVNPHFVIPPGVGEHVVTSSYELPQDGQVYAVSPHMHLRGKTFQYDLFFPDSRRQKLLEVPRFDFNWQHIYILNEPLPVPRGTLIHCLATFDNSTANPVNPDATQEVRWGDQIWQEMMIGYILLAFDRDEVRPALRAEGIARAQQGEQRRRQLAAWTAVIAAVLVAAIAIVWRRRTVQ